MINGLCGERGGFPNLWPTAQAAYCQRIQGPMAAGTLGSQPASVTEENAKRRGTCLSSIAWQPRSRTTSPSALPAAAAASAAVTRRRRQRCIPQQSTGGAGTTHGYGPSPSLIPLPHPTLSRVASLNWVRFNPLLLALPCSHHAVLLISTSGGSNSLLSLSLSLALSFFILVEGSSEVF